MRDRFIRAVLVVAIFTTIATSAPEDFSREDFEIANLAPQEVLTLRVVFSAAASTQAEELSITFDWSSSTPIMLIPDDPALPPQQLTGLDSFDALAPCSLIDGPCELVFSIDAGEADGQLLVTARASRAGDPSFCFPDNRDFEGDATVEVIFE